MHSRRRLIHMECLTISGAYLGIGHEEGPDRFQYAEPLGFCPPPKLLLEIHTIIDFISPYKIYTPLSSLLSSAMV